MKEKEIKISSKDLLPLGFCQEKDEIMIFRGRRENEEQRIQPPFQNNNVRDDESYEIDEGELDDLEAEEHNISQFG